MKTLLKVTLSILFLYLSCRQDEDVYPGEGQISHSLTLNIQIAFPDSGTYDSAFITFKKSDTVIKQKLTLNFSTHVASGNVTDLSPGSWKISTSFFETIESGYESLEKNTLFSLDITSNSTALISTRSFAVLREDGDPIRIHWDEYYYYLLYSSTDRLTTHGFVRLPVDPTNPFVEIGTFEQEWIYAYVDRSFYDANSDRTSNHYQGGGAFEIYGRYGDTKDRLSKEIVDTTSLIPGIEQVADKVWTLADCLIVVEGLTANKGLLLYHVWDLRAADGRIKPRQGAAILSKKEVEKRKQIQLH